MVTGIYETKTLMKHISCESKCKFDGTKCKSNQRWNNDRCWCECKKHHICEKDYVWYTSTSSFENGKCLSSIIGDSTIICDEVIESYDEETKTITTTFNEKKVTSKTHFTCIFIKYNSIIDSRYYLLLSDKISSKKIITISWHEMKTTLYW